MKNEKIQPYYVSQQYSETFICFFFFEAIRPWLENMTVLKGQTVLQTVCCVSDIFGKQFERL